MLLQGEVIAAERLPKKADTWPEKKAVLLARIDMQLRLIDDLGEAAQALASQRLQPEAPPSPTDALESFVKHDRCVVCCGCSWRVACCGCSWLQSRDRAVRVV